MSITIVCNTYKGEMRNMEETYKAVYQNGYAIFGIGKTDDEAIADAMEWVDDPEELKEQIEAGQKNVHGDMKLIIISRALRDAVIEHGGDIAIINDDGIYRSEQEMTQSQTVLFQYENEEIECKVTWNPIREPVIDFFDSHTGYTGKSDPGAAQGNWWYQDDESQEILRSLIEAVRAWGNNEDWTQYLSWSQGAEDVFEFEWDGVSRSGEMGEYRELTRK